MTLVEGDLLATPQRLADVRQVAFDETDFAAVEALRGASALFRRLTSQQISLVEGDVQELFGSWSCDLWLPQRPVLALNSLEVRCIGESTFTTYTDQSVTRRGHVTRWGYPGGFWFGPGAVIRVDYDHGYEVIPEDVSRVVATMAARLYGTANSGAMRSETIGSYTYERATTADGAVIGLTSAELAVIEAYRPKDA